MPVTVAVVRAIVPASRNKNGWAEPRTSSIDTLYVMFAVHGLAKKR
jgi:hypothetical protein